MANKGPAKTRSDVPVSFSRWMFAQAEAVGLKRDELMVAAGYDEGSETAWRLEQGKPEASAKAAQKMRMVLIEKYKLEIPPIPIGEHDWTPPAPSDRIRRVPREEDSENERIRLNLIRAREWLTLDQLAAADHVGVPYDRLVVLERGDAEVGGAELVRIAEAYGQKPGLFTKVGELPPPDPDAVPTVTAHVHGPLAPADQDELKAFLERVNDPAYRAEHRRMSDHLTAARKRDRER